MDWTSSLTTTFAVYGQEQQSSLLVRIVSYIEVYSKYKELEPNILNVRSPPKYCNYQNRFPSTVMISTKLHNSSVKQRLPFPPWEWELVENLQSKPFYTDNSIRPLKQCLPFYCLFLQL